MNIDKLKKFLMYANTKGYSEIGDKIAIGTDGSKTILIKNEDWALNDNFFGGEPYGGREVISYKGKPVWIMVYYGSVDESIDPVSIYPFLRKAISMQPDELPVRGPNNFTDGDKVYENKWEGNLERFSGSEKILINGKEIYKASYIGGLVDVRND